MPRKDPSKPDCTLEINSMNYGCPCLAPATQLSALKGDLASLKQTVANIQKQAREVMKVFGKYKDELSAFKNISPERQKEIANEVMVGVQTAYATASPCLRARKCFLLPYGHSTSTAKTWGGDACCPGQTAHHLLPDAMFRDPNSKSGSGEGKKKAKHKCWKKYNYNDAPTICLEGGGATGSHGAMHKATKGLLSKDKNKSLIDYDTISKRLAKIISAAYGCDPDCLKAQLDKYYKSKYGCPGKPKVVPHSGTPYGGPDKPSDTQGAKD